MGPTTPRKMLSWRRAEEPAPTRLPRWGAAVLTGLASGTFTALTATLAARHMGRCTGHDWMVLGTTLTRDRGIEVRPSPGSVAAGVVVHQAAHVAWAALWWSPMARIARPAQRQAVLSGAIPWALASVAAERAIVLPALRPLVRQQVPFRDAAMLHAGSALALPLYLLLRPADRAADRRADRRLAGGALGVMAVVVIGAGVLRSLDQTGRGKPLGDATAQVAHRTFLRKMATHHGIAADLARLLAERGTTEKARATGRLIWGERLAQLHLLRTWYRDWYGADVPPVAEHEAPVIPGLTQWSEVERLERLEAHDFQLACLPVLIRHLNGAVRVAEHALKEGRDPRVRGLARAIIHAETHQIETLEGLLALERPIEEEAVTVQVTERIHGAAGPGVPRRRLVGRLLDATRRLPLVGSRPRTGPSRVAMTASAEAAPAAAPPPRTFRPTEVGRRRPLDGASLSRRTTGLTRGLVTLGRQLRGPHSGDAGRPKGGTRQTKVK